MGIRATSDLPVPTEAQEQITLFSWAAVQAIPELALLYHIPNGGSRHKAEAARLRAEGVRSGVPDLCLPVPRGGCHGLYIELKRLRGGRLSEPAACVAGRARKAGIRRRRLQGLGGRRGNDTAIFGGKIQKMNPALLSSKNMCWCTPQDFFDKLNEEFRFVLDPAATEKTAKCPLYYTPETDGLSQSWNRGGAVFCNPPYGSEIGKWVKKAYDEAKKGQTIVLLLPARTDTKYFHDYIYGKAEIRFLRGRIRFTDEDGRASDPGSVPVDGGRV